MAQRDSERERSIGRARGEGEGEGEREGKGEEKRRTEVRNLFMGQKGKESTSNFPVSLAWMARTCVKFSASRLRSFT